MSKKVNPTVVGIFVAGALAMLLAGLIILGSGKFFEKQARFVVYFKSSANGLDEGADVLLGGVKVGSVVKMQVQFDPETREKVIPVPIELSAKRLDSLTIDETYGKDWIFSEEALDSAIKEGLRARLMTRSVLTGQLFVDLDFFPIENDNESYRFPGPPVEGLRQIPTTKNQIERVLDSIAEGVQRLGAVDLAGLIENLDQLVTNLDSKVSKFDLAGIDEKAKGTLENVDSTLASINAVFTDEKLKRAIANLDQATERLKDLLEGVDGENVNEVIAETGEAMELSSAMAGDLLAQHRKHGDAVSR